MLSKHFFRDTSTTGVIGSSSVTQKTISVYSEINKKQINVLLDKLQRFVSGVASGAFRYRCWNVLVFLFMAEARKGKEISRFQMWIVVCSLLSFYKYFIFDFFLFLSNHSIRNKERDLSCYPKCWHRLWEPPSCLFGGCKGYFPGCKVAGSEVGHLPPSSAEVVLCDPLHYY